MKSKRKIFSTRSIPVFLPPIALWLVLSMPTSHAQTIAPASAQDTGSSARTLPTLATTPLWGELETSQQAALSPLKPSWSELNDVQRRKWLAIVKNFSKLTPEDQLKIQERMAAWAALKPAERERARENFATAKSTGTSGKSVSWEEYQALPQDEREKLALQAPKKRPSAAKSPRPATTPSLSTTQTFPFPSQIYPAQPARGEIRALIEPGTLLPIKNRP